MTGSDAASTEKPRIIIRGWKAIAARFEVTIRTAQLWESERAMPVHRQTGPATRVFAFLDELDAWMAEQSTALEPAPAPAAHHPRRVLAWVAGSAALVFAAAAIIWLWPGGVPPSSAELRGRNLVARDASGRGVWQYEFNQLPDAYWAGAAWPDQRELTRPQIGDFDEDGRREVLFTLFHEWREKHISELYCFESDGSLRWVFRPGRTVHDANGAYHPPYTIRAVIPIPGRDRLPGIVAVVSVHYLEHPAQVAILSLQGEVLGEYWHSGYFYTGAVADLENDGRDELYLAGISNANREATVVALDPRRLGGASIESDPRYQLSGFRKAEEVARILLPATGFTRQTAEFPIPSRVQARDGRLVVGVLQSYSPRYEKDTPEIEYQFGPRLVPLAWGYTTPVDPLIERLAAEGMMRSFDAGAEMERIGRVRILAPWSEPPARPRN